MAYLNRLSRGESYANFFGHGDDTTRQEILGGEAEPEDARLSLDRDGDHGCDHFSASPFSTRCRERAGEGLDVGHGLLRHHERLHAGLGGERVDVFHRADLSLHGMAALAALGPVNPKRAGPAAARPSLSACGFPLPWISHGLGHPMS